MFKTNATAIMWGETYDVTVLNGPDKGGFYAVEVMFAEGDWTGKMCIMKENVWLDEVVVPVQAMN